MTGVPVLTLVGLSLTTGCMTAGPTPPVAPHMSTPDLHKGGPVTHVVTMHGWQDGSDVWRAAVKRPLPDAKVALFTLAEACL